MPVHSTAAVAYSYIRFSSKEQAKGDSLRRQTEKVEAYCQRRGLTLDSTLNLRDLGVSAFHGKNALVGNLKLFLDEVKRGTIVMEARRRLRQAILRGSLVIVPMVLGVGLPQVGRGACEVSPIIVPQCRTQSFAAG